MSLTPRIDKLERNLIINGAMDFNQRYGGNTHTPVNSSTEYHADRWYTNTATLAGKSYNFSKQSHAPGGASQHITGCQQWTIVSSSSLASVSDFVQSFGQRIEGTIARAAYGGKKVTIGFWFYSSVAGTYPFSLRNRNTGGSITRSYVTTFDYPSANTWQYVKIQLETDAMVSEWNQGNAVGYFFDIAMYGGSNYQTGSLNQWISGNYFNPTSGLANFLGTTGAVMRVTGVTFVLGDGHDSSEYVYAAGDYASELILCQRYFEKSYHLETAIGTITATGEFYGIGVARGTNSIDPGPAAFFKVTKRTSPTLSFHSSVSPTATHWAWDNSQHQAPSLAGVSTGHFSVYAGIGVNISGRTNGLGYIVRGHWSADAEL